MWFWLSKYRMLDAGSWCEPLWPVFQPDGIVQRSQALRAAFLTARIQAEASRTLGALGSLWCLGEGLCCRGD